MPTAPAVFLSAASEDLAPWRDLLDEAFRAGGCTVYTQGKSLGGAREGVRTLLADNIARSAFVVHLAGKIYGSHADQPFPEAPGFQCSWTQFEYYHAHATGKQVFAFVCGDGFPYVEGCAEKGQDADDIALKTRLQDEHRQRVASGKFDGTPLAGTARTLNKGLATVNDLLREVAACLGAMKDHALRDTFAPAQQHFSALIGNRLRLHTIPAPPAHFTGRVRDLEKLRAVTGPLVLTGLRGMGGIGKTALACVLAAEWSARFPDAQLLLDGRGTSEAPATPASLLEEIIRAFEPGSGRLPDDVPSLQKILRDLLHERRVLLLLDNAADAAQARALAEALPPGGGALLVTSRQSFLIGGVPPHNVDRLPDDEARALLTGLYPPLAEAPAGEIVRLCGGLPLALRLAGAHLALDAVERGGTADVNGYLRALAASRLGTLDRDAEDAGEITISETLRLSEARLTPDQRRAWHALGVFSGSCDAGAALAIAGADEETTGLLVRRSLLEREGERLRLHDLAADYCRAALGEPALHALRLVHAAHFTAVAVEAQRLYLEGHEQVLRGLALFDQERAQIESAFAFLAADPGRAAALIALVDAVAYTSDPRFHPRQRLTWLEAQACAARLTGQRQAEGAARGNMGLAHADLGDARRALECHEQQMQIACETGDRRSEGNAWGGMGNAHADLGDARRALECHEQQMQIARETGDRRGEGNAWGGMGLAHYALDDARRALECYEQQMQIAHETGDRPSEGLAWGNIGNAHYALGEARRALECYEQCRQIARETGDRRSEGPAWGNTGIAHATLGEARRALECYEQQMEITRETGDRRGLANALFNSALPLWDLAGPGERAEARRRMAEAAELYAAMESPNVEKARRKLAQWADEVGD